MKDVACSNICIGSAVTNPPPPGRQLRKSQDSWVSYSECDAGLFKYNKTSISTCPSECSNFATSVLKIAYEPWSLAQPSTAESSASAHKYPKSSDLSNDISSTSNSVYTNSVALTSDFPASSVSLTSKYPVVSELQESIDTSALSQRNDSASSGSYVERITEEKQPENLCRNLLLHATGLPLPSEQTATNSPPILFVHDSFLPSLNRIEVLEKKVLPATMETSLSPVVDSAKTTTPSLKNSQLNNESSRDDVELYPAVKRRKFTEAAIATNHDLGCEKTGSKSKCVRKEKYAVAGLPVIARRSFFPGKKCHEQKVTLAKLLPTMNSKSSSNAELPTQKSLKGGETTSSSEDAPIRMIRRRRRLSSDTAEASTSTPALDGQTANNLPISISSDKKAVNNLIKTETIFESRRRKGRNLKKRQLYLNRLSFVPTANLSAKPIMIDVWLPPNIKIEDGEYYIKSLKAGEGSQAASEMVCKPLETKSSTTDCVTPTIASAIEPKESTSPNSTPKGHEEFPTKTSPSQPTKEITTCDELSAIPANVSNGLSSKSQEVPPSKPLFSPPPPPPPSPVSIVDDTRNVTSRDFLKHQTQCRIPVEKRKDGTYKWITMSVICPPYTLLMNDDVIAKTNDDATSDSFHKSLSYNSSIDQENVCRVSRSAHATEKCEPDILTNHENNNNNNSTSGNAVTEHSKGLKHWKYVDDSIDVSGFDEELKLPSVLARDVHFMKDALAGKDVKHTRCTNKYATQRNLSLITKRAYFFWHDDSYELPTDAIFPSENFNIINDIQLINEKIIKESERKKKDNDDNDDHDDDDDDESKSDDYFNGDTQSPTNVGSTSRSLKRFGKHHCGNSSSLLMKEKKNSKNERILDLYKQSSVAGVCKTELKNDNFRLWGFKIKEGHLIRVLFLQSTASTSYLEDEAFQWFSSRTLNDVLKKISYGNSSERKIEFTTTTLAHYAPTIFWNLVFRCDSDCSIIQQFICQATGFSPRPTLRIRRPPSSQIYNNKFLRRKSVDQIELYPSEVSTPAVEKEVDSSLAAKQEWEIAKQHSFILLRDQARKRVKLFESARRRETPYPSSQEEFTDDENMNKDSEAEQPSSSNLRLGRRVRRPILPNNNPELVVKAYLDFDGFPKQILTPISLSHRRLIYGLCCFYGWTAPLVIKKNEKGRAVYAAKAIEKDDFICGENFYINIRRAEYLGEYISLKNIAKNKENQYEMQGLGSYMFYFTSPYSGIVCCIDATEEAVEYGPARLINHSHFKPNCVAMAIRNPLAPPSSRHVEPKLVFIAKRRIMPDEELLIDYGETNPAVLKANPWLLET